jgi:hypothetical protein
MPKLTALQALRNVLAAGWKSDDLAKDTATQALILDGYEFSAARSAVDAAFQKHFAIAGAA